MGTLQPGDEIVSVREGERVYETLETIRYYPWGFNPKVKVQIRARRNGQLFDCEVTPFVTTGASSPYPLTRWQTDFQVWTENHPDFHFSVEYLIEEGDLVACFGSCTGTDRRFNNRPYAYSQAVIYRIAGGKIVSFFGVNNTAAELRQQGHRILPPEE